MIRVMLVDDEELMRTGLRMMLEAADGITVVAEARDGRDAIETARMHRPQVVIMDIRMPTMDGIEATRRLTEAPGPPQVIVLTTFDLDEYVYAALEAGAAGFLLKDCQPEQLIHAVRVVADGMAMLSPAVTKRLIGTFVQRRIDRHQQARSALERLTGRERDVLELVGTGLSNNEISRQLRMSEATVKDHVSRILAKLTLTNRVQAAILAYQAGLIE